MRIVTDVLLGLAVLIVLIASLGVLVMPGAYAKLHYLTPAALLASVLVALAILTADGFRFTTAQAWLTLLMIVTGGPILTHVTGRAIRARQAGDQPSGAGEAATGSARDQS